MASAICVSVPIALDEHLEALIVPLDSLPSGKCSAWLLKLYYENEG